MSNPYLSLSTTINLTIHKNTISGAGIETKYYVVDKYFSDEVLLPSYNKKWKILNTETRELVLEVWELDEVFKAYPIKDIPSVLWIMSLEKEEHIKKNEIRMKIYKDRSEELEAK